MFEGKDWLKIIIYIGGMFSKFFLGEFLSFLDIEKGKKIFFIVLNKKELFFIVKGFCIFLNGYGLNIGILKVEWLKKLK